VTSAAGASNSLLVVESDGRHVGQRDRLEGAYVHPRLERRCYAEEINAARSRDLLVHENLLEEALAFSPINPIRLSG